MEFQLIDFAELYANKNRSFILDDRISAT